MLAGAAVKILKSREENIIVVLGRGSRGLGRKTGAPFRGYTDPSGAFVALYTGERVPKGAVECPMSYMMSNRWGLPK